MNSFSGSKGFWLLSSLAVALLVLALLFTFARAHLRLHARLGLEGKPKLRSLRQGRTMAMTSAPTPDGGEGEFRNLRPILMRVSGCSQVRALDCARALNRKEVTKLNAKKMIVAVAAALMLLVGAGIAYANGSGANGSGDDGSGQPTGPGMDKAKSVALEQVNGRVTATEFQDEEGYYEVEVTKADGTQVDVHLDKNYNVLDAQSGGGGSDVQDGPNDSNDSNDSGGG
jgi:uncharacterized membrane protein YkoI